MINFQKERIQNTMGVVCGVLLTVFIFIGCVAQKTENVQSADKIDKMQSDISKNQSALTMERAIHALRSDQNEQNIKINIEGNQKLVYTSIRQDFPFGIAIYLPETKITDNFKKEVTLSSGIKDVTVEYADEEKNTVKVEILLTQDLNYEVAERDNSIIISLLGNVQIKPMTSTVKETVSVNQTETLLPNQNSPDQTIVMTKETATMTHIEFNTLEDGKSDIVVHTNQPVRYDIAQKGDDTIFLNLYNTIVPEYHKRPLLTEYFKSAVERLMPKQIPGKNNDSKIEIKIRQQVPYRVVQNRNTISLFFDPSTITPPVFEKAQKKESGETTTHAKISDQQLAIEKAAKKTSAEKDHQENEEYIFGSPKVYTGEKIKLDFYETDIKNVFRILRSVGGLNFAIDKGVEGKVTMTLENPVPWDQVLDLVLKMNNLGQKKEGNVIRIATLGTLKKEETLMQNTIAARKKSLEQKKSLEPLVTEYIPINYSDATADIKPHIEQILTKSRGTISVDSRTNMVILTDIQEKIDQAKEIIFRLDKVTPQIMIEAKVVEVTKDFSRELGMGLNLKKNQTAYTGFNNDFEVALNNPVTAAMDFNFYRIFGSDFLRLNAKLAASETKGDVKVVSSPRILTLDNKKAMIKQGLEYAYLERDDSGGSSVKFKSIDLALEVTPHVTPDKRIAMTVLLKKNDIDSITNGVPSLSTNEAQTELLVNNNDTVVIGGIVKTTDNKGTTGTPFLSGIPILGQLFRIDIDSDKRNELLIFLTPSIVQLEQRRNTFTKSN